MSKAVLPSPNADRNLLSCLCPESCEDIVGVYLRASGFVPLPGGCRADTKEFEIVLRHRESGRFAGVQVKQGVVVIGDQEYRHLDGDVFPFQADGERSGPTLPNAQRLSNQEMLQFCKSNRAPFCPRESSGGWQLWCLGSTTTASKRS